MEMTMNVQFSSFHSSVRKEIHFNVVSFVSRPSMVCFCSKNRNGKKRASFHAASVILQVDRARLQDLQKLHRTEARLLPQAVIEELYQRIKANQWKEALKVFELLRKQEWYEPKHEQYVSVLTMLAKNSQPDHAEDLFRTMLEERLPPSVEAYTALLSAFVEFGDLDRAVSIFNDMKTQGDCPPDVYTYSKLIAGFCRAKELSKALELVDEMERNDIPANTVTYNALLKAVGESEPFELIEDIFEHMMKSSTCPPDNWSFNILLKALGTRGSTQKMEEWYLRMREVDVAPNIVTMNTLIHCYGLQQHFHKMERVLKHMDRMYFSCNEYTFNSMIRAYGNAQRISDMERMYFVMKQSGVKPTAYTLTLLVTAFTKARMWHRVEKVRNEWINSDLRPDIYLYNALLNAYSQSENLHMVEETFEELLQNVEPDDVTQSILARAYESHGYNRLSVSRKHHVNDL
ncbi:hypothetical protein Mapa_005251 [Marchantia paleacea]|nr:hypothetical protein Mapa_005251 [Marchantia paleacea]